MAKTVLKKFKKGVTRKEGTVQLKFEKGNYGHLEVRAYDRYGNPIACGCVLTISTEGVRLEWEVSTEVGIAIQAGEAAHVKHLKGAV